jgi:hypothetical protein
MIKLSKMFFIDNYMNFKYMPIIIGVISSGAFTPIFANGFVDLSQTHWAYQSVVQLDQKYGCLKGYPDRTVRLNQPATRAEVVALSNHCLDNITAYVDDQDRLLAQKLRTEIGGVAQRVTALEVSTERKNKEVGQYVGLGVLLNNQGIDGNGYTEDRTVLGGSILARFPVAKVYGGSASIRPYANVVGDPEGRLGAGGGVVATYDYPLRKATLSDGSKVSTMNVYGGVGYQVPFVNNVDSNYQSAVGDRGQVVFALGVESRITDSIVGFADLKLPTRNYGVEGSSYSPVFTIGGGIKIN